MPIWQRIIITAIIVIAAGFLIGLVWEALFGFTLPPFLAGAVGGMVALPTWHFLRRVRPSAS